MQTIMPIIATNDLDGVRDYYAEKLGFGEAFAMRGPDGELNTVSFGTPNGAPLMFGTPMGGGALNPDGLMLFVSVDNVDGYHDELAGRDVDIAEGLTDQFWGDRTFVVRDPWGLHLMFGQTVGEMSGPPEGFEIEMAQPVG
ncbi:MAG: glyoxalase superfamily protein [Thermomicrobiales bacterium]